MANNDTRFTRESAEVLYDLQPIVRVTRKDVDFLKETAKHNGRKRIRLCTHGSIEDTLHEMVITHAKGTYVIPHKHVGKIESFHVIEGTVDVVVFDDAGTVTGVSSMGDYQSGLPFYHRISEPAFHTLLITSDVLVFHEITNGPFNRSDTLWASWAPEETETALVVDFMTNLELSLERFNLAGNPTKGSLNRESA
jgi:cupin fold WbuC family metalloprotein